MTAKELAKAGCAGVMAATLVMQPLAAAAQDRNAEKVVELGPPSGPLVARFASDFNREHALSEAARLALLKKRIKYVFVLFQENRSFDFYFGTYPGARGLFSQPASQTPGFVQPIVDTNGKVISISPFLIPASIINTAGKTVPLYPQDTDSVNHGHTAMDSKLDLDASKHARNDRYAFTEEGLTGKLSADGKTYAGPAPTLAQKQMGELVVSHVDCDTVPFLWNYADRFTLFDNFFDTVIGPSTPNALAMFSAQSGVTQWIEHPSLGSNLTTTNAQLPVTGDPQPFWGSALNTLAQTPTGNFQPTESGGTPTSSPGSNQTYASLGLSFMGSQINAITAQDLDPAFDLADVRDDIRKIAGDGNKPVNWAWFQEGYDREPTDPATGATHLDYIAHHDAPQYFGYEANNPSEIKAHLKGLGDFYAAIKANALPEKGGVFYVRGGYGNLDGMKPLSPSPSVEKNFPGNDDHPGYSDAQISEAMLADSINAIARSKYWPESVIIITYDETDGLYDHTQPSIRSWDPLNNALSQGPRIPMILISPYAKVHAITHEPTEHGSIIKLIDKLFDLTPLAELPDEAAAQQKGLAAYGQKYLEPSDGPDTPIGSLFSAFDDDRLRGRAQPLPFWYAIIPQSAVKSMPHFGGRGCRALSITPTDIVKGKVIDPAPRDFNPRPSSNPGLPTTPGWPPN